MQLHKLLSGLSFVCILLGTGGLAGAVECGTGYTASGVLLLTGAAGGISAAVESGTLKCPVRAATL